jgi:hypothetical protein
MADILRRLKYTRKSYEYRVGLATSLEKVIRETGNSLSPEETTLLEVDLPNCIRQWTFRINNIEARMRRVREARDRDNGFNTGREPERGAHAPASEVTATEVTATEEKPNPLQLYRST